MKRQQIAEDKTAKIFLEDDFVYKSFPIDYQDSWIAYEVKIQNEIQANTSLAIPFTTYLKESREIKMAYVPGGTLADKMRKEKYKFGLDDLISTQLSIYQFENLTIPHAHDQFEETILNSNLPNEVKTKALLSLHSLERKNKLCHFDFHYLNVLVNDQQYVIIDWVNAKLANPVMDIARTHIILKQYAKRQANKYLKTIADKGNFSLQEIEQSIPLMAALRLLENDAHDFHDELIKLIAHEK